ncbi:YuzL family protein [Peribacillus frigoritolerans]|nr:YuzL family protein [Peribacillus frigoritolerans]
MMKRKDNPSKAAVSAASVKGNAGPGSERQHGINKVNSQNNQFKR